jgi:hypothetical protein
MNPALNAKILALLGSHRYMALACLRADGFPQTTTVGYVNDGLAIYFGCSLNSQKAHNLARDNRVSMAINRDFDDWRAIEGLSIGGTAERLTEFDDIVAATDRFIAKFPQVEGFQLEDMLGTVFFRVTPKAISVIDYTVRFGHSELVVFE